MHIDNLISYISPSQDLAVMKDRLRNQKPSNIIVNYYYQKTLTQISEESNLSEDRSNVQAKEYLFHHDTNSNIAKLFSTALKDSQHCFSSKKEDYQAFKVFDTIGGGIQQKDCNNLLMLACHNKANRDYLLKLIAEFGCDYMDMNGSHDASIVLMAKYKLISEDDILALLQNVKDRLIASYPLALYELDTTEDEKNNCLQNDIRQALMPASGLLNYSNNKEIKNFLRENGVESPLNSLSKPATRIPNKHEILISSISRYSSSLLQAVNKLDVNSVNFILYKTFINGEKYELPVHLLFEKLRVFAQKSIPGKKIISYSPETITVFSKAFDLSGKIQANFLQFVSRDYSYCGDRFQDESWPKNYMLNHIIDRRKNNSFNTTAHIEKVAYPSIAGAFKIIKLEKSEAFAYLKVIDIFIELLENEAIYLDMNAAHYQDLHKCINIYNSLRPFFCYD